jgi:hypothetical protein
MTRRKHRGGSSWPKRRQWTDRIACDQRLTPGAKSWLLLVASRSDDAGKPVWGNQVRMAEQLGRCDRSVRRYLKEAQALGYVLVFRSKPERGTDGRFCRRKSNSYYLCVPSKNSDKQAAPRRRQRASYCTISSSKAARARRQALRPADQALEPVKTRLALVGAQLMNEPNSRSADLADSDGLSTPLKGVRQPAAPPPSSSSSLSATHLTGLADARAALLKAKTPPHPGPSHSQRPSTNRHHPLGGAGDQVGGIDHGQRQEGAGPRTQEGEEGDDRRRGC